MTLQELTTRQRIAGLLRGSFMTAKDISRAASVREKEVCGHLVHIARSVSVPGGRARFVVEPSTCLNCGFVFRKRERLKTPSKCPICASEEITETRFGITEE